MGPARPAALLAAALMLFYATLCLAVLNDSWVVDADSAALRWAASAYDPALYAFLWDWVLLGQRAVVLAIAVVWLGVRAVRHRDIRPLLTLGVVTLLLNVTVGAVKTLIGRVGPLQLGGQALLPGASHLFAEGTIFPSGHTANAVVTWGLLAILARRRRPTWVALATVLAVTVGLSTIYLRTHWVSDVLAGWAAGGLVLLAVPALTPLVDRLERAVLALLRRLRPGRRPQPGPRLPAAAGRRPKAAPPRVVRPLAHREPVA